MNGFRHQARVAALQCLCVITSRHFTEEADIASSFEVIKKDFFPAQKEENLFRSLVFGVTEHRKILDEKLQEMAPKWKISSMSAVDRVLLEMGLFEMLYTETPHAVILNEVIEIAKAFGDDGSSRFVNGVLSKFLQIKDEKK